MHLRVITVPEKVSRYSHGGGKNCVEAILNCAITSIIYPFLCRCTVCYTAAEDIPNLQLYIQNMLKDANLQP